MEALAGQVCTEGQFPVGIDSNLQLVCRPLVTVAAGPLTIPPNLTATAGHARVDLSWTDNNGSEEGYEVRRCAGRCAEGSLHTTVASLPPNTGNFTDTDVSNGATYSYQVVAVSAGSESGVAGPVTATPASPLASTWSIEPPLVLECDNPIWYFELETAEVEMRDEGNTRVVVEPAVEISAQYLPSTTVTEEMAIAYDPSTMSFQDLSIRYSGSRQWAWYTIDYDITMTFGAAYRSDDTIQGTIAGELDYTIQGPAGQSSSGTCGDWSGTNFTASRR